MSAIPVETDRLRILLACARPMATRILELEVTFPSDNSQPDESAVSAVFEVLREKLKLVIVKATSEDSRVIFHLSAPLPDLDYLESEVRKVDEVLDVSHSSGGMAVDVHRPGEELQAVLRGMGIVNKSVEVAVLDHARPRTLRDHLDTGPGYDALYLACHGNELGSLLLEDDRGWARYVGASELVSIIGDRVKILVLGACHGERSLGGLIDGTNGSRPPVVVYARGEHVIPSRAVHLFTEGYFRSLADGRTSSDAFLKGVERVQWDDEIGEVACPDGAGDGGPSPFKRLQISETQPISFPGLSGGKAEAIDLRPPPPPHRKILRSGELMLGRDIPIARLIDVLLPPRSGLKEEKHRLVHLHGEGGIGKTRLAQTVCDRMEDYRHFAGGIYEVECENLSDSRQLAMAVLQSIGVEAAEKLQEPEAGLLEVLAQTTAERGEVLLMLDNLDPLFTGSPKEDTARMLKLVLSECPGVRVLSTCRTQLNLGDYECDFLIDPLDPQVARILFLLCVPDREIREQVQSLPEEDMRHVFGLVASLGGHPLSVFLAAHRIGTGSAPLVEQITQVKKEIIEHLEAEELAGFPPRQRSLRASLDLSYNLLSERAKELFRKSSFFPGGLYRQVSTLDNLLGEDWREAAEELAKIGLFRFERDQQWYWMDAEPGTRICGAIAGRTRGGRVQENRSRALGQVRGSPGFSAESGTGIRTSTRSSTCPKMRKKDRSGSNDFMTTPAQLWARKRQTSSSLFAGHWRTTCRRPNRSPPA